MTILRIVTAALGLGLLGAIIWASMNSGPLHGSLFDQGGVLLTLPWGVVTLVDLYVGFAFTAIIIMLAERTWLAGVLWALPILVLGNVWAAVWLLIRLPSIAQRLNRADWPQV
jgi:hypothetical protein